MVSPASRPAPHKYIVVKKFKTLNSQPARNALKPEEFSWIENFMPIGNGFAPMVPGPAGALATIGTGGGGGVTTLFLNHWNGNNESTTFVDEVENRTWSVTSGSPLLNTSNAKFGSAALWFDSGGGVRVNGFDGLSAEDFTIEGFARPDTGAVAGIGLTSSTTSAQIGANIDENSNFVQLFILNAAGGTVYNEVASISIDADVYKHIAVVYDDAAGTVTGYFDGSLYLQATSIDTTGYNLDQGDIGYTTGGRWDETRLVDSAVYSGATYVIPTSEFTP